MSIFNGKMTPLGRLIAKVTGRSPVGKADISPKTEVSADVESVKTVKGTISRAGKFFGGSMLRIAMVFRFITARSSQHTGRKAGASTAPATQINAESRVQAGKNATAKAHSAADAKVDSQVPVGVKARLLAYRRAACRYVKELFLFRKSALIAAMGAAAMFREEMPLERKAKGVAGSGAVAEIRKNINTGCEAAGCSAPVRFVPAIENTIAAKCTATANMATVTPININSLFKVTHRALLYAAFLPELEGSSLSIFQAFSGIQSSNVLEIDLETESAFWASAFITDGTLNLVFAETVTITDKSLEVA